MVTVFLNGVTSLGDANQKNFGLTITQSETYDGQTMWRNDHDYVAFVGNWNGTFPRANQTTPYNDTAAEAWYDGTSPAPIAELTNSGDGNSNWDINRLANNFIAWINMLLILS